jgi:hypothetical protein
MAMAITTSGSTRAHAGRMNDPDPEVPERARRRQYSAKYKLETLAEYDRLDREAKDACCAGRASTPRCCLSLDPRASSSSDVMNAKE